MVDVTDASFQTDVIERSHQIVVIVDLWATWCEPCKTLGPLLEAGVERRAGQMELAKVEVDTSPMTAEMFQVQSIPAVYALKDGIVIDGFVGSRPEAEIEAFLDRVAPNEADTLAALGDEGSLRRALAIDNAHVLATTKLAELLLARDEPDEALSVIARVPENAELHNLAARARLMKADVDLSTTSITTALEALLDVVNGDEGARKEYLDLLEALGPENLETARYRRALSSRLF